MAAGKAPEADLEHQSELLLTHLMDSESNHQRFGRTLCFPQEHFAPRFRNKDTNLLSVVGAMDLSHATALELANQLGETEFDRVFRALGFMKHQPQTRTALFTTECPGVPSGELHGHPEMKAHPCGAPPTANLALNHIGCNNKAKLFKGSFACQSCTKCYERQERMILKATLVLVEEQQVRSNQLDARASHHPPVQRTNFVESPISHNYLGGTEIVRLTLLLDITSPVLVFTIFDHDDYSACHSHKGVSNCLNIWELC